MLKILFQRREIVDLIREFVAVFERDVVEATRYPLYRLNKQITYLVAISRRGVPGLLGVPVAPPRSHRRSGEVVGIDLAVPRHEQDGGDLQERVQRDDADPPGRKIHAARSREPVTCGLSPAGQFSSGR